ncbi:MAG: hypothetical protein R6U29_12615, partial [Desulfosudaceae bacterium]
GRDFTIEKNLIFFIGIRHAHTPFSEKKSIKKSPAEMSTREIHQRHPPEIYTGEISSDRQSFLIQVFWLSQKKLK